MWLKAFRQGPLEWCWRCVTWLDVLPNAQRRLGTGTVVKSRASTTSPS
ncbi:DUF418 domain-containing protein [Nonomuraea sp. NPDC049152]